MSLAQRSFYVAGGTLRLDAACYVNRQADHDLYDGLKQGDFCYLLNSRQMGKSSLTVRAAARLRQEGVSVSVLDLTAIGQNLTAEQWYGGLLGHVGRQLKLRGELQAFWTAHAGLGPLERWMHAIREMVLPRCSGQVVIFVDEIDAVRSLPFSTDEFFAAIRECYNRRTEDTELLRLAFCLIGVATPSDLIRDPRTTPFNIGRRIELCDFTEADAAPLAQGLGRQEPLAGQMLKRVLYWTGGHPYLTQQLCRAVAEDATVVRASGVDRICQELFLSARARERDDNLIFVRQRILLAEDRAGVLDLYERVRRHKRVRDDETNPRVSELRLAGITRVVEGYLWVRNRIYYRVFDQEWVLANVPDAEKQRQRAAFRRGLLRASGVASIIVAIMAGLVLYARIQQNRAYRSAQEAKAAAQEAKEGKRKAQQLQEEALKEKERAEKNWNLAEQRLTEKLAALGAMLKSPNDDELKTIEGSQEVRLAFYKKLLRQYEQILRAQQNDPAVLARRAMAYEVLGLLQSETGAENDGVATLRKAVEYRRNLAAADQRNAVRAADLGNALFAVGQCFWENERYREAVPPLRESLAIFAELDKKFPADPSYQADYGRSLVLLTIVNPGKEDLATYRKARDLLANAAKALPNDMDVLVHLARADLDVGVELADTHLQKEADVFYEEARRLAGTVIKRNPSSVLAHRIRTIAMNNQAINLEDAGHLEDAARVLHEATEDAKAFARKNPAVLLAHTSAIFLQTNLAQAFQRLSKPDQAIQVWEEITQTCDGLARRFPHNARFPGSRIDALIAISNIDKNRNRRAAATVALDRAVAGARDVLRLHPHAAPLLGKLMEACNSRGQLESELEKPETALSFFLEGAALFEQFGDSRDEAYETTLGSFLTLAWQAMECQKKPTYLPEPVRLAERALAVGVSLKTQEAWLDLAASLAQCYDGTGQTDKAIATWACVRDAAAPLLEHAPWNYYIRANLKSSYSNLANLYRRTGNLDGELKATHEFLKQLSYLYGKDYAMILAETAAPTPENVSRLREIIDSKPGMKRFTVPTDFNGVKFPFNIYITDSIRPFDDQVRWVQEVRGGKVPQEVIESFHRLYKIAKDNNVSFQDLCVYAVGTVAKDDEQKAAIARATAKIEGLKKDLAMATGATQKAVLRHRLAEATARLAEVYLESKLYEKAENLKDDALGFIERDAQGQARGAEDRAPLAKALYVQGRSQLETGIPEQAYRTLLQSLLIARQGRGPKDASLGNIDYALGQACARLERRTEAASWYWSAATAGHPDAMAAIGRLYLDDPGIAAVLPPEFGDKIGTVGQEISILPLGAASAIGLLGAPGGQGLFLAAAALIPGRTLIADLHREKLFVARLSAIWQEYRERVAADTDRGRLTQLKDLATQYHDLAETYEVKQRWDDSRNALLKEYDALEQLSKLDSRSASRSAQAGVAAKIGRRYVEAKETAAALEWTERAASLGHPESLLQLADWYGKGINVKADVKKASRYRYRGYSARGINAFGQRRFNDALPDLEKACESAEADPEDYNALGICCGKLARWDEAIQAYRRSVDLYFKTQDTANVAGPICNLLEALLIADRPADLIKFVQTVEKKGWKLPTDGSRSAKYNAVFHGFRAIALRMSGEDSSQAELAMRQYTSKAGLKINWTWDELNQWLQTTKLAPDRKADVEKIIAELKGSPIRSKP